MLDELLYRFGRNVAKGLRGPDPRAAGQVELTPHIGRLQVLASLLCGQTIAVSAAADGPGGVVGDRIYLPATTNWFDESSANEEWLVLRLVFGLCLQEAARRRGFGVRSRLRQDERILATLLLWRAAHRDALAAYPGLGTLSAAALERSEGRPGDGFWTKVHDALATGRDLPGPWGELQREAEAMALDASDLDLHARTLCAEHGTRSGWFAARRLPVPPLLWLSGLVSNAPTRVAVGETLAETPERAAALPSGSELEGKSQEEVEVILDRPDPEKENPVLHLFEKMETAEDYQGTQRLKDGSDELEEHQEALDELQLGHVIRTNQTTDSLYRADLVLDTQAGDEPPPERDDGAIFYDEWDGRRRRYRRRHCRLYVDTDSPHCDAETLGRHQANLRRRLRQPIQELRAAFLGIAQAERLRSRQRDGLDLDLDAFVESHGRRAAGMEIDERIWWARRPRHRELAVLLLIDGSLSADSWVAGRRVLDIEREASFMLGEVLAGQGAEFGIASFHSNSRHDCRYAHIQGFDESWAAAQSRLFGLRPKGFTRIGPALRHATRELASRRSRRRLLLVLTDGKATDQDAYEGRYGLADVRQAVREAEQQGIHCMALAVEKDARHYLPALFGAGGFAVLPRPELLPSRIGQVLERFVGSP